MPPDDIELEILIAEEEARAKSAAGATPKQPSFNDELFSGHNSWDAVKGMGSGLMEMGEAFANTPPGQLPVRMAQQVAANPIQALDSTARAITSVVPGLTTGADYLGDVLSGQEKSPGDYGKMLNRDVTEWGTGAAIAGIPKALGMTKGVFQAAKDSVVGKPRDVLLAEQSQNADIFANKLNAASKRTAGEDFLVQEAAESSPQFVETNPVAGIDPSNGRQAIKQLQTNLENIKVEAIKTRNDIISRAGEAESASINGANAAGQQLESGIKFNDIATSTVGENGLTYGLDNIINSAPEGGPGVARAQGFIGRQFGITPSTSVDEFGNALAQGSGRPLTIAEADVARRRIDAEIRGHGGYDEQTLAAMNITPSLRDSYVQALKFYRGQLDSLIKTKIGTLLSPADAEAFAKAGANQSMAADYGELAGRFERETGQAFAPGSAKALQPGTGPLGVGGMKNKVLEAVSPEMANRRMQTQQLQREGRAIEDLQRLIGFRTGAIPMPAPRSWALVKTNMEHLQNIGMIAMQLGLVRSIEEFSQLPDAVGKQMLGAVAMQAPQIFEQNPDRINVVDRQFMDPTGKSVVVNDAINMPAEERAKRIGGVWNNQYVPPSQQPKAQPTPLPALPVTIDRATEALTSGLTPSSNVPLDLSYDNATTRTLEQLTEAQSLHALN